MSHHPEIRVAFDAGCTLAESPVWDAANRRLLFADIPAGTIHAFSPASGEHRQWRFDRPVGSFGLARSGRLVVAVGGDVVLFDPATGTRVLLATVEADFPRLRLNDGKVGPDGAFWVGTIHDVESAKREPIAALFRVDRHGTVRRMIEGLKVSNGLAWSPDGRQMFHSDSAGPWIDRWDFDPATGDIAHRTRIATPSNEEGRPDGGACDAEGHYWSSGVSAGCLNRYAADGRLLARIPLPVPAPTMPCFAGEGLRTLYVSSLRRSPEAPAPSGAILELDPGVAGAEVALFDDDLP
ncbi:SMP-30/gluconolactonase/LRE family protein [Ancylobacter lacus]|uniref:SMP-30/gluconolactonase/LRE family protein n=1 Tax=Ancylobacter lacus TaxID=2579970 RepID=UPI001BCB1F57|nr:SMP-30/gluconolactonase/LRE family protein [Ancylobacter lacus]MBS7538978.1 SMP-30/gluconolactonase/LRE family protein [Ancylobacter lacus]